MIDGITGPAGSTNSEVPTSSTAVPSDPSHEDTEGFNTLMSEEPEGSGTPPAAQDAPAPKAALTEQDVIKAIESQIVVNAMEDGRKNREALEKIFDKITHW